MGSKIQGFKDSNKLVTFIEFTIAVTLKLFKKQVQIKG